MRKRNKWKHGRIELVVPPLPTEVQGRTGCQFYEAVFDVDIGLEVYLAILETGDYARAFADTKPFNLFCNKGMVRTDHGIVGYLIWTIAQGSPVETVNDQFVNPHESELIRMMSALGQQTYMKTLIIDSITSEVSGWFEFENTFGFSEYCGAMAQSIGHEPAGDFQAAMAEVMERYTTNDLLGRS